jgi:thiol-disulfide isomerase/thioredoxin
MRIHARIGVLTALFALAGLALAAAGCGSDGGPASAERPGDAERLLAKAPPPIAELVEQRNEILGGGVGAFEERLKGLRGHPVVVNKWASWCGPCRFEFPFFQSQAAKHGARVAFLGVDSNDSDDAARTFLEQFPVPYPSYSDPDQGIAESLGVGFEFPATVFLDRDGEQVYAQRGGYASEAELAADIRRHALRRVR